MRDCSALKNTFTIGQHTVGESGPTFIIAEIGINHGGDPALCATMIEEAARAGASAVKLQTVDVHESYVPGTASFAEFDGKSLTDSMLKDLISHAGAFGIELFSTPGDFHSLERIMNLGMPAIKISSGLLTNHPLIFRAARFGVPMIMSTGLAFDYEVQSSLNVALEGGVTDLALLKCTSLYPSPDETINLLALKPMYERFAVPVGYSDHCTDSLACVAAVAHGAVIIEKHFTLDKALPGADHHISADPVEFSYMVQCIRRIEKMRGSNRLHPVDAEIAARPSRHRCLVASADIEIGEVFTDKNVSLKRPIQGQSGLSPDKFFMIIGRQARRAIRQHEPISDDAVEVS